MRVAVNFLLILGAFALGVIVAGFLGDQGRGVDPVPFLVGAVCAGVVGYWRLGSRPGSGQGVR